MPFSSKKSIFLILLVCFFEFSLLANEPESQKFSPSNLIMHHIADSHEWHFTTLGHTHASIPLPCIVYTKEGLKIFMSSKFKDEHHNLLEYNGLKLEHDKIHAVDGSKVYDFSITKNVASLLLSAFLLIIVFFSVSNAYQKNKGKAPNGIQSFFEPVILFLRDEVIVPNVGHKYAPKFLPYLLTLFFFIWFNNLLGLLPGGANLTGNITITFSLAIFTFIIVNFNGKKGYWKHLITPPGVPIPLLIIMIPVEIVGLFMKPFSLMIRLFANITAGHIILLALFSLIFIFQSYPVTLPILAMSLFMNAIELLVATLQAYIFTLLTCTYIGAAVHEEHH